MRKSSNINPFGGELIAFLPIPEGYRGENKANYARRLSTIIDYYEKGIRIMGSSIKELYYEYRDGYCQVYYEIVQGESAERQQLYEAWKSKLGKSKATLIDCGYPHDTVILMSKEDAESELEAISE